MNYELKTKSKTHHLTVLRSYGLTILRPPHLTVLRSYGLTVFLMRSCSLTVFLMLCLASNAWCQQAEYKYDAAGNRSQRKVITLKGNTPGKGGTTKSTVSVSDEQTGISDASYEDLPGERKLMIYPNPTQGLIRIGFQGTGDLKEARLLLFDVHGKLLRQVNRVGPSNILDLSQYPQGMYILQIIEDRTKSEWKIVKE